MSYNFWDNIELKKATFTAKELEVCNLLKTDPFSFSGSTATEIAKRYNISQASISRFCQKLGFNGYSDFRMNLILASSYSPNSNQNTTADYAQDLSNIVLSLGQYINDNELEGIATRILNSRTSYTSGYGASDTAASLLAFRAMLASVRIYHIQTSKETETLHIMNNEDTVILFSSTNPSHIDFISTIENLPEQSRPYIILVTSSIKHPFAKKVNQVVVVPHVLQTEGSNPLSTPYTIQIIYALFLVQKIYNLQIKKPDKQNTF